MPEETRDQYIARVMDPRTYGVPVGQVTTAESINDVLLRLKAGGVNVLGPLSRLDFLPARHALRLNWIFLDQRVKGEWYKTPGGGGLSMHAVALDKLAQAAGMTWPHELTYRTDDGRTPLYWRVMVGASLKLMGGDVITKSIPGESDLRDGSAEAEKVLAEAKDQKSGFGNLMRMRAKGSQRCVSITMAALIRKMLCIRGSYSEAEADMPFVWPTTMYVAPVGDPELDRLIAIRELGLGDMIYGRRPAIEASYRPVDPLMLADTGEAPDFRAEAEKLDRRERVPVEHEQDRRAFEAAGQPSFPRPSGPAVPPPTERAPWDDEEPTGDPATPSRRVTWQGLPYTADEIRAFCTARQWLDATAPAEAKNVPKFVEWANGKGASTLSAFFAK